MPTKTELDVRNAVRAQHLHSVALAHENLFPLTATGNVVLGDRHPASSYAMALERSHILVSYKVGFLKVIDDEIEHLKRGPRTCRTALRINELEHLRKRITIGFRC